MCQPTVTVIMNKDHPHSGNHNCNFLGKEDPIALSQIQHNTVCLRS